MRDNWEILITAIPFLSFMRPVRARGATLHTFSVLAKFSQKEV